MKLSHKLWKLFVIVALMGMIGCQTKSSEKREGSPSKKREGGPGEKQEARTNRHSPDASIELTNAWARPGSQGANSAVYMTISNRTTAADTLVSISSKAVKKAALHESYQENGMSGMRPVGKKAIAPQSALGLKPGGYHIMMIQLNKALKKGDSVSVELHFSKTGTRRIAVPVKLSQ